MTTRTTVTCCTASAPRTTRVFDGMHQASAHIAGATLGGGPTGLVAASPLHAINISGGLHHAMADNASGFCIYNDPAIAIAWMLAQGAQRVAYVDIDVHHGDGVQAAFYDDPRVLTISLHECPQTLFPGTGHSDRDRRRRAPRARRSTWRCRRAPATAAGSARSTRSCRHCCASSGPTSWSASTAATPTWTTRSPT